MQHAITVHDLLIVALGFGGVVLVLAILFAILSFMGSGMDH